MVWWNKKIINHHPLDIYKEDISKSQNRVFVVGDIHGKYDLLKEGLEENKITENDFLIFAGDLINKGDDSIKVLDFVLTRPNTLCLYGLLTVPNFLDQSWSLSSICYVSLYRKQKKS